MTQINELLWSPFCHHKFIVFGNYILMQKMNLEKNQMFFEKIWLRTDFPIIKCVSWGNVNFDKNSNKIECLAIGRSTGHISLIKVPTNYYNGLECQPINFADIEIAPTHNRPVNALAWNTNYTHLIGALYERHRNDFALMVWDLNAKRSDQITKNQPQAGTCPLSSDESANEVSPQKSPHNSSYLPLYSTGYAEAMSSFAWLPSTPNALIAGQNYKQLRIYDLRVSPSNTTLLSTSSPTPATPSTLTKAVHGINFDPLLPHRLSSFVEDQLYLWDLRNFEKPTNIITSHDIGKPILKTAWCPTRRNLMAVLLKESTRIKFIDFNLNPSATQKCVYDRDIPRTFLGRDSVTSLAWHTLTGNSVLAITSTGSLHNVAFQEKIVLDFSSRGLLAVQSGPRPSTYLGPSQQTFRRDNLSLADTTKMEDVQQPTVELTNLTLDAEGAVEGSFKHANFDHLSIVCEDIKQDARRADDSTNQILSPFQRDTFDDDKLLDPDLTDNEEDGDNFVCRGVCDTFMRIQESDAGYTSSVRGYASSSSLRFMAWHGSDLQPDRDRTTSTAHYIEFYVSETRDIILTICDWNSWLSGPKYDEHVQSLMNRGRGDIAIAFTVFRGDIQTALNMLTDWIQIRGRTSEMEASYASNVAAVVAGFSPSAYNAFWLANARRLFTSATACQRSPYLLAVLAFLLTQTTKYHIDPPDSGVGDGGPDYTDFIVNDRRIRLKDRVAFSCLFFDDAKFRHFLLTATEDHIVRGDLEGILLTGLDDCKAMCLLQNYVDRTLDVLTVTSLAIKSGCVYLLSHPSMLNWFESYRALLDRNRLWERRAEFDTDYYQVAKSKLAVNPPQQVFVSCNFCGRQIMGSDNVTSPAPEVSTTPKEENFNDSPISTASTPSGLFKETGQTLISLKTSSSISSSTSSSSQPAPLQSSNKKVASNCPGCGKSLPRCALCLLNMNALCATSVDGPSFSDHKLHKFAPATKFPPKRSSSSGGDREGEGLGVGGSNPVSDWFSWCQRCAHGGHALHMFQWFEANTECPVSGCNCQCWEIVMYSK